MQRRKKELCYKKAVEIPGDGQWLCNRHWRILCCVHCACSREHWTLPRTSYIELEAKHTSATKDLANKAPCTTGPLAPISQQDRLLECKCSIAIMTANLIFFKVLKESCSISIPHLSPTAELAGAINILTFISWRYRLHHTTLLQYNSHCSAYDCHYPFDFSIYNFSSKRRKLFQYCRFGASMSHYRFATTIRRLHMCCVVPVWFVAGANDLAPKPHNPT